MVRSPTLEAVGARAIGLRYGEAGALALRLLDGQGAPMVGSTVSFGLVGDAGGSTLSGDRAVTDGQGEARVQVLAGAAEAAFRVVASAAGAADLGYAVTVSSHPFVELEVKLAYAGVGMGQVTKLRGLLYDDRPCAALPASTSVVGGALREAAAEGSTATLSFPFLLARGYALVGSAEDADGRRLAYGCVDVPAAQFAPGGVQSVLVPLAPVRPLLSGRFAVTTTLAFPTSGMPSGSSLVPTWDALAMCPAGLAQQLLDRMVAALGDGAVTLSDARTPLDEQGCRPTILAGQPTVDGMLQALLSPAGSPAALLPAVVADLDALVATATLRSTLTIGAAPSADPASEVSTYYGTHTLDAVAFAVPGGASANYDLASLGLPLTSARLDVALDGSAVRLGLHGLTLRLPMLWRRALTELALTPRGLPDDAAALMDAAVAAASNGDATDTGCAAVEDVLCGAIEQAPACGLKAACAQARDALAKDLAEELTAPAGIDLRLVGTGTAEDGDGDLVVDAITAGSFDAQLGLAAGRSASLQAGWSAMRVNP